jgi:hypothetical protein
MPNDILFPTDTTSVTPATWDIIMLADVSDSNNLKETTLAELPISTATQAVLDSCIKEISDEVTISSSGWFFVTTSASFSWGLFSDELQAQVTGYWEWKVLKTDLNGNVTAESLKTINGNSLLGSGDIAISGGGGVTDHWALTGLTDDDHTQYTKADWTRAFTGKVSYSTHPTFSADTELVDKKYVDDSIIAGGGYTDEQAQDAVGTILVDSGRIEFTYNDWTPSITADIIDDSVTFTKIQNIHTNRILGRSSSWTGDIEELNVNSIPALIGLWTSDSPQFAGVNVWHANDTTITRVSSGKIAVEWVNVGTEGILQNSQSANYTLVLTDAWKSIYHPSADTTARTWTIPANSSVAFPIGTAITFVNDTSAGTITISITTDTLVLTGAWTTGSRTLASNWVATAIKVTSTRWIISGNWLT